MANIEGPYQLSGRELVGIYLALEAAKNGKKAVVLNTAALRSALNTKRATKNGARTLAGALSKFFPDSKIERDEERRLILRLDTSKASRQSAYLLVHHLPSKKDIAQSLGIRSLRQLSDQK